MRVPLTFAMADMRGNLAMCGVMLALGAVILVGIARVSDQKRPPSHTWLPLTALIAGPVIGFVGWAIYFMFGDYVIIADAWELLPVMLVFGTIAGLAASITFGVALRLAVHRPVSQPIAEQPSVDK